jgi:hypothetical protein
MSDTPAGAPGPAPVPGGARGFGFPHPPTSAWREEALARAAEIHTLSAWIDHLLPSERGETRPDADRRLAEAIRCHVQEVYVATGGGPPRYRTGGRLARATSNLDAAEADLLRRAPPRYLRGELPNVDAHVRRHLPVDDPRRLCVEDLTRKARDEQLTRPDRALGPYERESVIGAFRAASSAAAREQMRVRSFTSIIAMASVLLFLIAIFVAVLAIVKPTLIALCFEPQQARTSTVEPQPAEPPLLVCPTGQSPLTDRDGSTGPEDVDDVVSRTVSKWDVPLIECVGMVAAGVTGAIALRRLRGVATPFAVPVALNVLKLPTGALTAVLGLVLMRGGFVPGLTALDTTPQIIAWAVVFGASQQLFTGMVDRQAQTVLESVGGKTYTATGGG